MCTAIRWLVAGDCVAARRCASALGLSCVLVAAAFGETLPVSADTYTKASARNKNFGSAPQIRVRSGSHAGYLLFDLGSLGSGEVRAATLRIRVDGVTGPADIAVHEVLAPWREEELTHKNAPPLNLIPTAESQVAPSDRGNYIDVDVTALVNGWIANPGSNFGLNLQSSTPNVSLGFSSREAGYPAELDVELISLEKPNFARVEVQGGDYSDPVAAMNDSEQWCDLATLPEPERCQLLIGPGTFLLGQELELPTRFDVLGAGKSGSRRTELVAGPGVEAVIRLLGNETETESLNSITGLSIRNAGGANGNVMGIWTNNPVFDGEGAIIRNVSVDVRGGAADAVTGIRAGMPLLRNVDVHVEGGSQALGIFSNCADAADVQVRVFGNPAAQSATGWSERSDDCGPPQIVRFSIASFGGPDAIGMELSDRSAVLAEGTVTAQGVGILANGGAPDFRNLRVSARTAIDLMVDSAKLDDVDVPDAETALNVRIQSNVRVTDSTLLGDTGIRVADQNQVRIDSSSTGPISIEGNAVSVFIGSSKVEGPIVAGPGQLTCVDVYDQNYQPVTCE
jgi:hypothetical protein